MTNAIKKEASNHAFSRRWTKFSSPARFTALVCNEFTVIVGLFLICYFTYFLYSDLFGVYSDDQFFVYAWRTEQYFDANTALTTKFGRPLAFISLSVLPLLLKIGGTPVAYLGVAFVLTAEAALVTIFFRYFFSKGASFVLAIVYILFPTDAAKFLLVHGFALHISSMLYWIAAILYIQRRPAISALLVSATIFIYETHLAQGILMPLVIVALTRATGRQILPWHKESHQVAKFWSVFLIVSGISFLARMQFLPGRLDEINEEGSYVVLKLLFSGWSGLAAIIHSHLDRIGWVGAPHSATTYITFSTVLLLNLFLYQFWKGAQFDGARSHNNYAKYHSSWACILLALSFLTIYVSYLPFALEAYRWPPIQIDGRLSSIHWGAAVGYTFVWASLYRLTTTLTTKKISNVISLTIFFTYAIIMFGFFQAYQLRLIENWRLQSVYWDMISQCVVERNPKIVVIDSESEEYRLIGAAASEYLFDWTTPYLPLILSGASSEKKYSPIVVPLELLRGGALEEPRARVVENKLEISPFYMWYRLHSTRPFRIESENIMMVKPFDGALVHPPEEFVLGDDTIVAGLTCYRPSPG